MDGGNEECDLCEIFRFKRKELLPDFFFIQIRIRFLIRFLQLQAGIIVEVVVFAKLIGVENFVDCSASITAKRFVVLPERLFAGLTAVVTCKRFLSFNLNHHDRE